MSDETSAEIEQLADSIADRIHNECIDPDTAMALNCRIFEAEEDEDGVYWPLLLSPAPTEIFGGANDGKAANPRFSLDIMALASIFDNVEALEWNPHPRGSGYSPYLVLRADYSLNDQEYRVAIEISSAPIEGEATEGQTHFLALEAAAAGEDD